MKVIARKNFFDLKEKVDRTIGEEFEATQARIDEINAVDPSLIEVKQVKRRTKAKEAEEE